MTLRKPQHPSQQLVIDLSTYEDSLPTLENLHLQHQQSHECKLFWGCFQRHPHPYLLQSFVDPRCKRLDTCNEQQILVIIKKLNLDLGWSSAKSESYQVQVGFSCQNKPKWNFLQVQARLVAKGFSQIHGMDYDQISSPMLKYESICTVLALVAYLDMGMIQFDICTAYLNGQLQELIYIAQPEGFEVKESERKILLLFKSFYSLK